MSPHATAPWAYALFAALFITNARAADYSAGFLADAEVGRNDNIRLVQDDKTAATRYRLTPGLKLGMHTETSALAFDSTADLNKYDKTKFDSNDLRSSIAYSRQSERSSIGLDADYVRNSTLTSELLTSGRIGNVAERAQQYSVTPSWSYAVSEINIVQLNGTYSAQSYNSDAYTDYTNMGGELDWIHAISSKLKTVVALTYSRYESDDIVIEVPAVPIGFPRGYFGKQSYAPRTKSVGGQLGIDYQWSEQTLIKLRLGRSKNDTSYPIKDPNQICSDPTFLQLVAFFGRIGGACELPDTGGPQSSADLTWRWNNERHQFSLNGSKAILPTSNGYAVDSTQLGSHWSYQLSELNRVSANLTAARNRAIDKNNPLLNTAAADRDYATVSLEYERQLTSAWLLDASVNYSKQKYTQADVQASSRSYSLGLRYRPQLWHWAR
jgi:hypothetical protein